MESPDLVRRAKEIDPGGWSLNGTDQRRREAVWKAYREQFYGSGAQRNG